MNSNAALDTIEFDGLFFAREEIIVRANDLIVFQQVVDNAKQFQTIYGEFVIDKLDTVDLSVQTFFNNRRVMDTAFIIPPGIYINSIGGSICYPSYIPEDSLRSIKEPHHGDIPIDSCRRYVTLIPDSIMYKYPRY